MGAAGASLWARAETALIGLRNPSTTTAWAVPKWTPMLQSLNAQLHDTLTNPTAPQPNSSPKPSGIVFISTYHH